MAWLRFGLCVFFALVIVEGAIRKWLLPQQQELVYLAKDIWLACVVAMFFANQRVGLTQAVRSSSAGAFTLIYIWWVVLEGVNPALPSLTLGVWGVRSHLLYVSLVWLIPASCRSSEEIVGWFRALVLVAVPVLVLGAVQFFSPSGAAINRYAAGAEGVATFGSGGAVRVSGTFPYISGMAVFVFAVSLVAFVLLLAGRLERRWRVWLGLALSVGVTPMTGSRWGVAVWLLVLPAMMFQMSSRFPGFGFRLVRLVVGIALVGLPIGLATGAGTAVTALSERADSTDDTQERIIGIFSDPVMKYEFAGLTGYGAGSTHQAAGALVSGRAVFDWLPTTDFEGESGRLILELGLIGFVLALAMKTAWALAAHNVLKRARTHAQFVIGMVAFGFFLAHLVSTLVFNATAGALYWGFAGALACVLREQWQSPAAPRHRVSGSS